MQRAGRRSWAVTASGCAPNDPVGDSETYAPTVTTRPMSGPHRVRRHRLRVAFLLGCVTALGPLTVDLYIAALPTVAAELRAGDSAVQLTLTGSLLGMAVGQLVVGPLSDTTGRRRPLLLTIGGYLASSGLCAVAGTVEVLVAARLVQGFAGGAALVVALAVVRDLYSGRAAARLLSRLTIVSGLAPILAPPLGAQLLRLTSWRGVFVFLAVLAALLLWAVFRVLQETLPSSRRRPRGLARTASAAAGLGRDRRFIGLLTAKAMLMAAMFAYIADSAFVFQQVYGLSEGQFGILFGVVAGGIMVGGQLNAVLVHRARRPDLLVVVPVTVMALAAVVVLMGAVTDLFGLVGVVLPIAVMMVALGVSNPTATALALSRHPRSAGTASAFLGSSGFVGGAVGAPMVGSVPASGAIPMGVVMVAFTTTALVVLLAVGRPWQLRTALDD